MIRRLKGSGGYITADITDEEASKARLAGELFITALGKIDAKRIVSYHCNNCSKEFDGAPKISSDLLNEVVTEGHVLIEQGEYSCNVCSNIIAIYKIFGKRMDSGHTSIKDLLEMRVYHGDEDVGRIKDIVVDKSLRVSLVVTSDEKSINIPWESIKSINNNTIYLKGRVCSTCGYENSYIAEFCIECGNRV
jgi:sporulation protein YlmC with PRC-barrel domain